MTARQRYLVAAAIAVAMASGISACAQEAPCTAGVSGGVMMAFGSGNKNNIPFSGTVKTSFEQKLADGNAIHTVRRSHQARDSAGRMMTEMPIGCLRGEDGQMHEIVNMNVTDPVARTNMMWQVNDNQPKVVRLSHESELPVRPVTRPPAHSRRAGAAAEGNAGGPGADATAAHLDPHREPGDQGF